MFEAEYKIIADAKKKSDELEAKIVKLYAPLGIKQAFDFPGKAAKTAPDLAKLLDDNALKAVLAIHGQVVELNKAYQAAQKKISDGWEAIEKQRKQEAQQILAGLENAKSQVFQSAKFHPGCKHGFLTPKDVNLINDAIKVPGPGGKT